jgi:hypothetical protein
MNLLDWHRTAIAAALAIMALPLAALPLAGPATAQPATTASTPAPSTTVPTAWSKYPVVNSGDWRSLNRNLPWSRPVVVRDPFDGDYLAVLDRNYRTYGDATVTAVTIWSKNTIRAVGYVQVQDCGPYLGYCSDDLVSRQASYLEVKVGNQIFRIPGDGSGNFPVSPALASAPSGQALTRITFDGIGQPVNNPIGAGTVQAWKVVYAQT